ncbi:MAG: c-type cytochrome domain-containing protein, partial [Acidobacteriota bacterium]
MLRWLPLTLLALTLRAEAPDFQRDVRPLLSKKCIACHGPDEHSRQAGLRLDQPHAKGARILARVSHPT